MDQEMQSGSQYDCSSFECFATTSTSHQIQESLELQIVNDLQEKYRPRYKSDMILSMEGDQILRCVRDRFGNNHVTLKMTPHIQGKIRVNWLTISDKTGQRYIMPYHIQARDGSHLIPDSNSIIFDINTDDDGFMKLKLGLCKTTWRELEGSQPLSLFQPITDALHTSNILPHTHLSPKRLIREFQLDKSQLAFTLCTRGQNESSVPQWHTTVFSNVMTEVSSSFGTQPKKLSHFYMFPSNTDIRNDHEQQLSTVEDTVERKKRQKLDATENMEEPQSTINAESMVNVSLLSLPTEIVHCIFDHCDTRTIFSMRRVCKQIYACANAYNRFKLICNATPSSFAESIFRHLRPERVFSLIIFDTNDIFSSKHDEVNSFYSLLDNLDFTRLRSLTFHSVSDASLKYFVENCLKLNCLVSISVESEQSLDKRTWAFVLSTFSQYNLRKLCMSNMETLMGNISWPNQWNLEHLEIDDCTYNSYLAILQHLPHLRTFSMRTWIIDDVDEQALSSSDNTFTAPLESLTMRNCSLSTYYLEALLSLTPSLRYLKLVSAREVFDSFFDNVYWEKLISIRLQKLHKFEFIFFHTYNKKDDPINLDVLVASFRSSFWHDDKRWFIVGAYFLRKNEIWLYTTPIHFPGITDLLRLETSWTNNAYHLTQRPLNRTLDTSLDETLTILDLHSVEISHQMIQHLIGALHENTSLVELNLGGIKIGNEGAKALVHALQNNKTLTILYLWQNHIQQTGAKYLADLLRTNTTLKELYLGNNPIRDQGAQYLAHALQNNTTLTTLDLHANGIGNQGIRDLANVLKNNKTLTTLGIGYNHIGDEEAQYLANSFRNNSTLQHLYLGENDISTEVWQHFQTD